MSVRPQLASRSSRRRRAPLLAVLAAGALTAPSAQAAPPSLTAPSAAVVETSTGTVLYAKNGNAERGMASTTKLMTALVALDREPLSTVLSAIDYHPQPSETKIGLAAGEKMTLADLVRSMMLPSANDAAMTVGVRTGGTKARFVGLMNARAAKMGLTHTHFTNPVGLDSAEHYTTAIDLARIGAAAHENPFLRATVRRRTIRLASGDVPRTLVNRNAVLGDRLGSGTVVDGMKTGHTNASGYSLVGSATRDGVSFVSVVLGEPSEAARDADTVKLLRWAAPLMDERTLVEARQPVATVPVAHGKAESVRAVIPKALRRVIPRGAEVSVAADALPASLEAPVAAGVKAGVARVRVNGKLVDTVPLVTAAPVEREGAVAAAVGGVGDHWKEAVLALLLLIGGTLTVARSTRSTRPVSHPRAATAPEPTERTTAP